MTIKSPKLEKDALYKMYWIEGRTLEEIGKKIGCATSTVHRHMEKFGIKIKGQSDAHKGKHHSDETRRRMSEIKTGMHPSEETCRKISDAIKGEKHHLYGKHHSEETIRKMSEARKGKHHSEETIRRMSGKHPSEATRKKMSDASAGEKHYNWQGGKSFEPYCPMFDFRLKEKIRKKYGRVCFICGKTEEGNGQRLSVHHLDGDKAQGCNGKKLSMIPLCKSCHSKIHMHDIKLNNTLLEKLNADGYISQPPCFPNTSLNDYR